MIESKLNGESKDILKDDSFLFREGGIVEPKSI
jgi:hypothetical protein